MRLATKAGANTILRGRYAAVLGVVFGAFGFAGLRASEVRQIGTAGPVAGHGQAQAAPSAASAAEDDIRRLVARLDAASFASRRQAARELIAHGKAAVPCLVEALGAESCELRVRARLLLNQHDSFEDVAPFLMDAVEKPYGFRVRTLLRERALQYMNGACRAEHVDKLFKFWSTDITAYREGTRTRLEDARTRAEFAEIIEPLLGLVKNAARFSDAMSRLEALFLPYDHQHSPGYVIAATLAGGMGENHPGRVTFAERHLQAFETLVFQLRLKTASTHTIRKEVSERATMTTSAVEYLVQVLDESSPERKILSQRIGLTAEYLQAEFCGGLASVDPVTCHRRVGKVHIADMLTEVIRQWPDAPHDGAVQTLIASTAKTATQGDKPKALALLDALEACRDLSFHGLDVRSGLGKRLGERLCVAAVEAPNNRVYHPARSVHDKFLELIDSGIVRDHNAFPGALFEDYLQGVAYATSDEQRLALERYLRILDHLRTADLSFEQPGVERFTDAMREFLTAKHELLTVGVAELDRVLSQHRSPEGAVDGEAIDRALAGWTKETIHVK